MTALYNEIDEFAASWLEQLIAEGRIAPGVVDRRSIEDLDPDYVRRFRQVHLFAGIGVWSLALRRAGWSDDRPVWTASCPCQPFSAAGKGAGFDDERHLWPALFHLITQCRPDVVLGEQVASKDGLAWLDLVHSDLEGAQYAVGAVDTCAAGFGAPHIRQRLYWAGKREGVDDTAGARHHGAFDRPEGATRDETWMRLSGTGCGLSGVAQPHKSEWGRGAAHGRRDDGDRTPSGRVQDTSHAERSDPVCGLADTASLGHDGRRAGEASDQPGPLERLERFCDVGGRPGPTNGLWREVDWLACRDGKWRPVEPGTFPLAHAGAYRNRVGLLRGAGNAVNLAQAQGFIEAVMHHG